MDSNIDLVEQLKLRDETLDILVKRVKSWDETPQSGIEIIEENKADIEKLQSIERFLGNNGYSDIDEEYINKITILLEGEKKIVNSLLMRKAELENIMKQLGNKDKIINNYLKKNESSLFIDRDF